MAICAANSPEWIITFWATVSLGAIAVGMNSLWAAPEIAYGIANSAPAVLVVDGPRRELAGDQSIPVVSVARDLPALIARYAGSPLPLEAVVEDDPAVILYTSGTSGRPKGATHSHRNVLAACWFHLLNDAVATVLGHRPADRRFLLAPRCFTSVPCTTSQWCGWPSGTRRSFTRDDSTSTGCCA